MCRRPVNTLRGSGGYTLIELLVVISILVILVSLAIPSFTSMIASSRESQAQALLETSLQNAQRVAAYGDAGRDSAAVFMFDPGKGMRIVTCVVAGQVADEDDGDAVIRDVFVPVTGERVIALPSFWHVRGYAPAGTIDDQWYGTTLYDNGNNDRNWVFPETAFFEGGVYSSESDLNKNNGGIRRHTFMVRFKGGTGAMTHDGQRTALVLDPRQVTARTGLFGTYNPSQAEDYERFVRRITGNAISNVSLDDQRQLLGDISGDTVLVRPVTQLVLYDERDLARDLRVDLDRQTQSLFVRGVEPEYVSRLSNPGEATKDINAWLNGDTNLDGLVEGASEGDVLAARVYTVDRYTAALLEATAEPDELGRAR